MNVSTLFLIEGTLIKVRPLVLPADYTGQLTVLLRYPSPQRSLDYDIGVKHTSLLVRQALALQMSPTPATGVSLMNENWNLLNIPMDVQRHRRHCHIDKQRAIDHHPRLRPPFPLHILQVTLGNRHLNKLDSQRCWEEFLKEERAWASTSL